MEIISTIDTIQRISHTDIISYDDSNTMYGGDTIIDKFRPFMMALCQGNGSAPQIWSIITSVVFLHLRSQGFGIHLENSSTTEITQLVGFSYVDDCNMVQSDDDVEATHSQIQPVILEWGV